jgi:AcrR family transcriptional regulator
LAILARPDAICPRTPPTNEADDLTEMANPDKLRRTGYAPGKADVGRLGLHTRNRITDAAARLFVARGFHGTSIDNIAKAIGGSRATIYQYFENKEDIYRELAEHCVPAVVEHGQQLGRLGPDAQGVHNLHCWLEQWAAMYDAYAVVFLEFPGIGTVDVAYQAQADLVTDRYSSTLTTRLREAGVCGIDPTDAAAAMLRIAHMVNLFRYRGMFNVPPDPTLTTSLTVALQLLLFPETPADLLASLPGAMRSDAGEGSCAGPTGLSMQSALQPVEDGMPPLTPAKEDILAASATLFGAHGYYSVGMEDIAAAAGVSRATLYRHFGTKVAILTELTRRAVTEGTALAADLERRARHDNNSSLLRTWLARYVHFHQTYGGVVRTWYDGGLSRQLAIYVSEGMQPFRVAAATLLSRWGLAPGIDIRVGVAIVLAVLGRLSELSAVRGQTDDDMADLMLLVLQRGLQLDFSSVR